MHIEYTIRFHHSSSYVSTMTSPFPSASMSQWIEASFRHTLLLCFLTLFLDFRIIISFHHTIDRKSLCHGWLIWSAAPYAPAFSQGSTRYGPLSGTPLISPKCRFLSNSSLPWNNSKNDLTSFSWHKGYNLPFHQSNNYFSTSISPLTSVSMTLWIKPILTCRN